MPYIAKNQRTELDKHIEALAVAIAAETKKSGDDKAFAGMINYTSTRLALQVVKILFGKPRYWIVAMLTGVFQNVSQEFYRRIASPYEDVQIQKNGDVDMIEELTTDH